MVACYIFYHVLTVCLTRPNCFSDEFPLLTTKRVFWKGVLEELLWFIKVRVVPHWKPSVFTTPGLEVKLAAVSHSLPHPWFILQLCFSPPPVLLSSLTWKHWDIRAQASGTCGSQNIPPLPSMWDMNSLPSRPTQTALT